LSLEYAVVPGFLQPEQCETLRRVVSPYLQPAKVYTRSGVLAQSPARIADNVAIPPTTGPAFVELARRIDDVFKADGRHAEDFQFVRYRVGGGYEGHFDWHGQKVLERPDVARGGQRTWTAMLYLKAPKKGGETCFPLVGIRVQPVDGTLLVWKNLDAEGRGNPWAWHEAKPVLKGEKWIVTRWYRQNPVRP
jgi:prolyl 4-hydroxylase